MKTYFTGCEHINHFNIIRYCNRPFKTVKEMNDRIIFEHNQRVKEDDMVYHLGDIAFYGHSGNGNGERENPNEVLAKLNGNHIYIEGNHDRNGKNKISTKNEQIIINQRGTRIQMLHDPAYARIDYDLIIHSHVHNLWKVKELIYCGQTRLMINVGVDVWNFRPVSLDEVLSIYCKWTIERKNLRRWEKPQIITDLNKGTISEKQQ